MQFNTSWLAIVIEDATKFDILVVFNSCILIFVSQKQLLFI